jgi:methionine-rich copper-binding protein CopC
MKHLPLIAGVCALAGAIFASPYAFAHAALKESSPAPNSTVAAPKDITLVFNEKIEPAFSSITVNDATGKKVAGGKGEIDAANPAIVKLDMPPLAPGAYAVLWVGVGPDGHRRTGQYRFTVK